MKILYENGTVFNEWIIVGLVLFRADYHRDNPSFLLFFEYQNKIVNQQDGRCLS